MYRHVTSFVQKEWIPLCIAVFVGLIAVAPHLFSVQALGDAYQGYPFIYLDDEDIYMARIQEIIDGHLQVGSPALFEYKNVWPPVIPALEYVYALPTVLLGVPLLVTMVISKFLLPALLFLLLYHLAIQLLDTSKRARITAIAIGLVCVLGYSLVDIQTVQSVINNSQTNLLLWTRPVNPIFGALVLSLLLIVLTKIHLTSRSLKENTWLIILAGALLGISIAYFFSWFIAGGITGLLWIYHALKKTGKGWQYFSILGISVLLQSPYWFHTFLSTAGEDGKAFALRNGAIYTHDPILNKIVLLSIIVFISLSFFAWIKEKRVIYKEGWWIFCCALLIASIAAFNEQIITGMTVWPHHFVQYTIPLCMIVLVITFYRLLSHILPRLFVAGVATLCVLSILFGVRMAQSYTHRLEDFSMRQTYMPLFSYLNQNADKDCVVVISESEDRLSRIIPAFSHCNVYSSTYAFFGVPEERIIHNYMIHLRLQGVEPDTLPSYLDAHASEINTYFFEDYTGALSDSETAYTKIAREMISTQYKMFFDADFLTEIKKYRADFLLETSKGSVERVLPQAASWQKVFENESLTLFALPQH